MNNKYIINNNNINNKYIINNNNINKMKSNKILEGIPPEVFIGKSIKKKDINWKNTIKIDVENKNTILFMILNSPKVN